MLSGNGFSGWVILCPVNQYYFLLVSSNCGKFCVFVSLYHYSCEICPWIGELWVRFSAPLYYFSCLSSLLTSVVHKLRGFTYMDKFWLCLCCDEGLGIPLGEDECHWGQDMIHHYLWCVTVWRKELQLSFLTVGMKSALLDLLCHYSSLDADLR